MMIESKLLRTSHRPQELFDGSQKPRMAGLPYNPNGFFGNVTVPSQPVIIVRAEEALIVVLVLALWIAAIALFFNRWGKIRMLEPYQPKFTAQHRPSCPLVDPVQHHSFSKFNISGDVFLNHQKTIRPRQNSVFVGSSMMNLPMNASRKVKSAFDLQNFVFSDPALNKSTVRLNSGGEYFRRPSLLPFYPRKSVGDAGQSENPQHSGERRLSFKDLVDIERAVQRGERVQCYLEKEPTDTELSQRNRKLGETKQRSTISNQSSLSDSRHNSITNQDLKPNVTICNKLSCHDRRSSLMPNQRDFSPSFRDSDGNELRPEVRSGVNNFRRNSMLLINSLENERNFLNPRENVKSGVIDFRRNSMLIINNLTEDIGYRSIGRNYSLGGSNIALGADLPLRRNSVIPPYGSEPRQKLSVPHVSVPKAKSSKASIQFTTETKHISSHKASKSLDCGDVGKAPSWRSKKEASQPSLVSEAKQQFLMPIVPQNIAGSSASLNTDYSIRENKSVEESRSTGNLTQINSDKSDFIHPKIIETKCCSPKKENGLQSRFTVSSEDFQMAANGKEETHEGEKEDPENKTTVDITTSLMNLNITSTSPLSVVTSSEPAKKTTNTVQSSQV